MRFILLDFSGTIVRHKEAVKKAMKEYNYPYWRSKGFRGSVDELYEVFIKTDRYFIKNRIEKKKPIYPGEYELKVAEFLGVEISREEAVQREFGFQLFYAEHVELVEGAERGIKELSKLAPLFLFSHADTLRAVLTLQRFDLLRYFTGIIPLTEIGLRKPTGDAFRFVAEKLGTGHIVVGDKEHSDGVGERFGFKFVDVKMGWDKVVERVREILNARA